MKLILFWHGHQFVITNSRIAGRFATTETKLYVPVVALSTQDNT